MNYTIGTVVFGDWHIVREIGEGSFGKVFEIQKTEYGVTTRSALKVIRIPKNHADVQAVLSEGMDEQSITSYFQGFVDEIVKEIAVMTTLKSHAGIVSCEDHKVLDHIGEFGWDILIRMELLTPLTEYQLTHTIDEALVRKMAIDLTGALSFCQKKALIHRDIKPENIFVSPEDYQFKLGDFGVARTAEKTIGGLSKKGTESYMAPEVYLGRPYGSTVDIYSLGLVLYKFMNYGRLPFLPALPAPITFADRENALTKRMQGVPFPPPAGASPELAAIILKACAYDPADRYRTADEMLAALHGRPVSRPQPTPQPQPIPQPQPDEQIDSTIGMWGSHPQASVMDHDNSDTLNAWNIPPKPQGQPTPPPQAQPMPSLAKSTKKWLIIGGAAAAAVILSIIFAVTLALNSDKTYVSSSTPSSTSQNSNYYYATADDSDALDTQSEDYTVGIVPEAGFDYTKTPLLYTLEEEVALYWSDSTDPLDLYTTLPDLPDSWATHCYVFFDANSMASPEEAGYTARGIQIGSTRQEVAWTYGTAFEKNFDPANNWLYQQITYNDAEQGTNNAQCLDDCSYFCVYRLDPQWHLEFYFNANDEVIVFNVVYGDYDQYLD